MRWILAALVACALTAPFLARRETDPCDGQVEVHFDGTKLVSVLAISAREGKMELLFLGRKLTGSVTWHESDPVPWRVALGRVVSPEQWKVMRDEKTLLVASNPEELANLEATVRYSHFNKIYGPPIVPESPKSPKQSP